MPVFARRAPRKRTDTQKSRVYAAGWEALPGAVVGTTVAEVQAYVDKLVDYAWFRRRWGSRHPKVQFKRGLGGYNPAYSDTICIGMNVTGVRGKPPGAQKATVLHELAHVLCGPGVEGEGWHGPTFTRTLLELVSFEFDDQVDKHGRPIETALREAYKTNRVKVGPPTTLRAAEKTPPPRPVTHTYRAQLGAQAIVLEAFHLGDAMERLVRGHRQACRDASEIRVWKSRAPAVKVASRPASRARKAAS